MKLARGKSAGRLIHALEHLGYEVIRQRGSHVRLRHEGPPAHSITVPLHKALKTGTVHGILGEVARMRSVELCFALLFVPRNLAFRFTERYFWYSRFPIPEHRAVFRHAGYASK